MGLGVWSGIAEVVKEVSQLLLRPWRILRLTGGGRSALAEVVEDTGQSITTAVLNLLKMRAT